MFYSNEERHDSHMHISFCSTDFKWTDLVDVCQWLTCSPSCPAIAEDLSAEIWYEAGKTTQPLLHQKVVGFWDPHWSKQCGLGDPLVWDLGLGAHWLVVWFQYEGSVLLPSRSERIISWGAKAPISQDSLIGFKTTAVAPNNLQAINLFKQYWSQWLFIALPTYRHPISRPMMKL